MTDEIQEYHPVKEILADGSGDHFVVGAMLKFTLWSWQRLPGSNVLTKVMVARIARPVESLNDSLMKTQRAIGTSSFRISDGEMVVPLSRH